jgi:hypothetical protein
VALPKLSLVNDAINAIFAVFSADKTAEGARTGVSRLEAVAKSVKARYGRNVLSVDLTDATDASPTAAFLATGEVGIAYGAAKGDIAQVVPVGTLFSIAGTTEDFTDNALGTAKTAGLGWTISLDIVDATDATMAAFLAITGKIPAILGRVLRPFERFKVLGTDDTTDNALEAVKGSAVASGDVFEVNSAGTSVTYVGAAAAVANGDVFEVLSATTVGYVGTLTELDTSLEDVNSFVVVGSGA